jgi:acetoin utilization deacetylase AcuC-like enzyme
VLKGWRECKILNPMAENNKDYLKRIDEFIRDEIEYVDIIGVCAGFDSYIKDVGRKLHTFDYYQIGQKIKLLAKKLGHNRRFAVLEGGYYLPDLGKNVISFCQGME